MLGRSLLRRVSFGLVLCVALTACGAKSDTRVSEKDGKTLLRVPAGEFVMGSKQDERDAENDELPQHTVSVSEFWIDKTETTNAEYRRCVAEGTCKDPEYLYSQTHQQYYNDPAFDAYPVIFVSWDDANAYCRWAGRRLPTEAEWEKAARGIESRRYPWGDEWPDGRRLNLCDVNCSFDYAHVDMDDLFADTSPVGNYPDGASPYGALDIAGNVWEWISDWYAEDYYAWSTSKDPQGPEYGTERVLRGGAWNMWHRGVRTAARDKGRPNLTYPNVGIRCASN